MISSRSVTKILATLNIMVSAISFSSSKAFAQPYAHKALPSMEHVNYKPPTSRCGPKKIDIIVPDFPKAEAPPPAVFIFETERRSIEEKIGELERLGAGIKPYSQALATIDEIAKKENMHKELRAAVDQLRSSLDNQLATMRNKGAPVNKSAAHAAATHASLVSVAAQSAGKSLAEIYSEVAQSILRRAWKPNEYVSHGVSVFFTVDENGAITNVAANPNSKGNSAEQERFKEFISGHPELPPPPKGIAPIKLIASQDTRDKLTVARLQGRNPNIDYSAYMAEVQRKIKRDWHPPHFYENKRVTVIFRIDHDGRVIEKKVKQSSGLPAADAAALTAIDKAAPFPPLPKGGAPDVAVSFTFDYSAPKFRHPIFRSIPNRPR